MVLSISSNGISWGFVTDVTAGQYANGDWWVLGNPNTGVTLSSITPQVVLGGSSVNVPGAPYPWNTQFNDRNGSMLNPHWLTHRFSGVAEIGGAAGADGKSPSYGFHGSSIPSTDSKKLYTREANWAVQKVANNWVPISNTNRKTLAVGNSLVSCDSTVPNNVVPPGTRTSIRKQAILTCVSAIPATGSFRPAYSSLDKTSLVTSADIDYTVLANVVADPVIGFMPSATYYDLFVSALRFPSLLYAAESGNYQFNAFENIMCDGYGQSVATIQNTALAYINTNALSLSNKATLANYLIQRGIDCLGAIERCIQESITLGLPNWRFGGGGQMNSMKAPLIFLAGMLKPGVVKERVRFILAVCNEWAKTNYPVFVEDGQLFTVSTANVLASQNFLNSSFPQYNSVSNTLCYTASDIGSYDWRMNTDTRASAVGNIERKPWSREQVQQVISGLPGYNPAHVDSLWNPYRICCSIIAWTPAAFAFKAMGIEKFVLNELFNRAVATYMQRQKYGPNAHAGGWLDSSVDLIRVNGSGYSSPGTISSKFGRILYELWVKNSMRGPKGSGTIAAATTVSAIDSIGLPTLGSNAYAQLDYHVGNYSTAYQHSWFSLESVTPVSGPYWRSTGEWEIHRNGVLLKKIVGPKQISPMLRPTDVIFGRLVDKEGNRSSWRTYESNIRVAESDNATAYNYAVWVDAVAGSNSNAGTLAAPVQTFIEARSRVLANWTSGGTHAIFVKRGTGQTHNNTSTTGWPGSDTTPGMLHVRAYGSGADPVMTWTAGTSAWVTGKRQSVIVDGITLNGQSISGTYGQCLGIGRSGAGTRNSLESALLNCTLLNWTNISSATDDQVDGSNRDSSTWEHLHIENCDISGTIEYVFFGLHFLRYASISENTFGPHGIGSGGTQQPLRVYSWDKSYIAKNHWDNKTSVGAIRPLSFSGINSATRKMTIFDNIWIGNVPTTVGSTIQFSCGETNGIGYYQDIEIINHTASWGQIRFSVDQLGGNNSCDVNRLLVANCSLQLSLSTSTKSDGGTFQNIEVRDTLFAGEIDGGIGFLFGSHENKYVNGSLYFLRNVGYWAPTGNGFGGRGIFVAYDFAASTLASKFGECNYNAVIKSSAHSVDFALCSDGFRSLASWKSLTVHDANSISLQSTVLPLTNDGQAGVLDAKPTASSVLVNAGGPLTYATDADSLLRTGSLRDIGPYEWLASALAESPGTTDTSIFIEVSAPFYAGSTTTVFCNGLSGYSNSDFMSLYIARDSANTDKYIQVLGANFLVSSFESVYQFTIPPGGTRASVNIPVISTARGEKYILQAVLVKVVNGVLSVNSTNALKVTIL